ncbi:MAG: hypothetical protein KKA81_16615, partial [Bacteroidetes bacterium]|nr:hypothetical protein [Bacteroidota bacterium]
IEGLDGYLLPYPHSIVGGKLSICRPVFRTGGMLGVAASPRQGNLVIGDNLGALKNLPALTLFTGGADFLLDGWAAPRDRRDTGIGLSSGRVFRVGCLGETCWGPEVNDAGYTMSIVHSAIAGSEGGARAYLVDQTQPAVGEAMNVSFRKSTLFNALHPFIGPIFTSYRATPNAQYGLSKGAALDAGIVKFAAGLLLGDPTFMFEAAAQNYNYAGVIAGGAGLLTSWPTGGVDQCMCAGMFVQRDRALGFGYPDLFAGIVENFDDSLPPVGDPASHRFQITWDDTVGLYRKINYGWSEARTFFHNIPMPAGQPSDVGKTATRFWKFVHADTTYRHYWLTNLEALATYKAIVVFPLNLPDGSAPIHISAYCDCWSAGAVSAIWNVRVIRCDYTTANEAVIGSAFGGLVLGINSLNAVIAVPEAVCNDLYHYQVAVEFSQLGGTEHEIKLLGLRLKYTMQDFLPA